MRGAGSCGSAAIALDAGDKDKKPAPDIGTADDAAISRKLG
jgi:hypothetical protein